MKSQLRCLFSATRQEPSRLTDQIQPTNVAQLVVLKMRPDTREIVAADEHAERVFGLEMAVGSRPSNTPRVARCGSRQSTSSAR